LERERRSPARTRRHLLRKAGDHIVECRNTISHAARDRFTRAENAALAKVLARTLVCVTRRPDAKISQRSMCGLVSRYRDRKGTVSPLGDLGFHRIDLIAPNTLQVGAAIGSVCWGQSLSAVQASIDAIHYRLRPFQRGNKEWWRAFCSNMGRNNMQAAIDVWEFKSRKPEKG
jgi:hypothetical protein